MPRFGHTGKVIIFRAVVLAIGLSLFAAQISYKFYQRASMPVAGVVSHRFSHASYGRIPGNFAGHRLSLDKRFDVKSSFALLTPVISFDHFSGVAATLCSPCGGRPADRDAVPTALRGPPPPGIIVS